MNSFLLLATLNLCLGGLVFLLGLLILRENPRQRLNRVVAQMLFFGGFGSILGALTFVAMRPAPSGGVASAPQDFAQSFAYLWEFFFPSLLLFASIFPEERSFARRFRSFEALLYAPYVFHFLLLLLVPVLPSFTVPPGSRLAYLAPVADVAGLFFGLFLKVHRALFSLVNLGYGAATVLLLLESYRRVRVARLKEQLRVIGVGLTTCLALYSLTSSIPTLLNIRVEEWARSALTIAALTVGSGAIAYSIVRYKFLDVKLLARRGILYAVTSAVLVGLYLTVVGQLNRLFVRMAGVETKVFEPVFLILALILFQPVMTRLEEMLEKVFLRDPGDYRNVIRNLGKEILTTIDLDVLLARSIRTISDALLLNQAHVVALTRGGAITRAGAGEPIIGVDLERVAAVLRRLPPAEESFRLGDLLPALDVNDRRLLAGRLGISIVIPLRSAGETVGAFLLGEKVTLMEYTSEDVALLTSLAGTMSVSLQNALLLRDRVQVARFEEELNLARQIQRSFLLSDFPDLPRFQVHASNIPSKEVGGDFYDLVPSGDGSFYLAIADVAGKGVPAALLSSMLQASLRTQASSTRSVPEILRNINSLVYRSTSIEQFATFFLARLDPRSLRMSFSNAGHNYPVVLRRTGERVFLDRGGIILGIVEGADFEEDHVSLRGGDRVVFYTDGISEAVNGRGEEFGEERLCEVVRSLPADRSAREITDRILEALRVFLGEEEPRDDMTLMVLRVLEPEPARREGAPDLVSVTAR
jgi:serine phosphatase RsbU (regulator of sigma subunit)